MEKKIKKTYSAPVVVALGLEAKGSGLCAVGSGDNASCENGLGVILPDITCGAGDAAGLACGSGWSASGSFCSGGMYHHA